MTLGPEQADRLALACIFYARRRDPAAIRRLAGDDSDLTNAEKWDVADRFHAADQLSDRELEARMLGLGGKAQAPLRPAREHKLLHPDAKTAVAVDAPADTGTFSGYLAVIGNRDDQGDTIQPGAMDATVANFRAGGRQWFLTDAHSDRGSDVVAQVTDAMVDGRGLKVAGSWMPTEPAQRLRAMVRAGAHLGLSIDWLPVLSRPDGKGGRLLDEIAVFGGAVTSTPANGRAFIIEGKGGWAGAGQVVTVQEEIEQGRQRRDPDRDRRRRESAMLDATGWPPPELRAQLGDQVAAGMVMRAAEAKSRRELQGDPERARAQARRDRANEFSYGLAESMAREARTPSPCGGRCVPCRRGTPSRCSYR